MAGGRPPVSTSLHTASQRATTAGVWPRSAEMPSKRRRRSSERVTGCTFSRRRASFRADVRCLQRCDSPIYVTTSLPGGRVASGNVTSKELATLATSSNSRYLPHLRHLSTIVQAACLEYGVNYRVHPNALASHPRWIHRLGQLPAEVA
jgi:hypothetical protein